MKFFTIIKLFIGLVLFGTLVALYVYDVPNCDHLKQFCEAALIGLGVMHLGGPGEGIGGAAPDKQGGFARLGFLGWLIAAALASATLTACTTAPTTTQQMQVAYIQQCAAYDAALTTAIALRSAGKLSQTQIDQITLLDSQITPICTGPLPTNPSQATTQITAAVTTLAILETVKKE